METGSQFVPVAFILPTTPHAAASSLYRAAIDRAELRHSGNTRVWTEDNNNLFLDEGELLVFAHSSTIVHAKDFEVRLEPGSLVLMEVSREQLSVRNLSDEHANSVSMTSSLDKMHESKAIVFIAPGEEIEFGKMNHNVARRNTKRVAGHQGLFHSEYSLVSLAQASPTLSRLLQSKEREDQKLSGKTLKTAAILGITKTQKGPYAPDSF